MYSRKFQTHINNNDMMNNNCNNTVVANNKNAMLNPLVDYENNNNNFSGMTHTENGLRAASHVSMEHTAQAHEFQPTCKCADCQSLIKHYTNYEILDAYVTHHLAYESSLQANFGFVPCIGGPFGHVAMKTVIDQDGNENQQPVPSNTYVFHMHLHHMNPVPTDVKERSLARFLAPKETIGTSSTAMMTIPTPNSKRVNNNHNHGRMMNTNNNKAVAASPSYNNNNNYYGHHQQSFNQHPHFNNYNNLPAYTRDDVEQAAYVSNFTGGAARLGN